MPENLVPEAARILFHMSSSFVPLAFIIVPWNTNISTWYILMLSVKSYVNFLLIVRYFHHFVFSIFTLKLYLANNFVQTFSFFKICSVSVCKYIIRKIYLPVAFPSNFLLLLHPSRIRTVVDLVLPDTFIILENFWFSVAGPNNINGVSILSSSDKVQAQLFIFNGGHFI